MGLKENAKRLAVEHFGPQTGVGSCFASTNAGTILKAQQDHVEREKEEKNGPRQTDDEVNGQAKGMPANALPFHYSGFEDEPSEPYPLTMDDYMCDYDDLPSSDPWLAEEREWFNFKSPCEERNLAGVQRAFSENFSTLNDPSLGLIKNMRSFGEVHAKDDPKKVFEFFEWVEWLTKNRHQAIAQEET